MMVSKIDESGGEAVSTTIIDVSPSTEPGSEEAISGRQNDTSSSSLLLHLVEEFGSLLLWTASSSWASILVDSVKHRIYAELDQVYVRKMAVDQTSSKNHQLPSGTCNPEDSLSSCSTTTPPTTDSDEDDNLDVEVGDGGNCPLRKQYDDHHDDDTNDAFRSDHVGFSRHYWRDIILGVNDGLVSTFLVVAVLTGADVSNHDIMLTAIAGLIAGAISMAAGEYIATKTQEEVFAGEVSMERSHIAAYRQQELSELPTRFGNIGLVAKDNSEQEEVNQLHQQLMAFYSKRDQAHLLAHMALEFGILEDEKRSPLVAGSIFCALFCCGALPPFLPFAVFANGTVAFIVASILTMAALLSVGAVKTWVTRGNMWNAAIENLVISAGRGAIAFGIGYTFHHLVNGGEGRVVTGHLHL